MVRSGHRQLDDGAGEAGQMTERLAGPTGDAKRRVAPGERPQSGLLLTGAALHGTA